MATFWTGAALAADYGQSRVIPLGAATRPHQPLSQRDAVARREAFQALNQAIGCAVQAQLDEPPVCWLDDVEEYDWLMHGGGNEYCYCQPVLVRNTLAVVTVV